MFVMRCKVAHSLAPSSMGFTITTGKEAALDHYMISSKLSTHKQGKTGVIPCTGHGSVSIGHTTYCMLFIECFICERVNMWLLNVAVKRDPTTLITPKHPNFQAWELMSQTMFYLLALTSKTHCTYWVVCYTTLTKGNCITKLFQPIYWKSECYIE